MPEDQKLVSKGFNYYGELSYSDLSEDYDAKDLDENGLEVDIKLSMNEKESRMTMFLEMEVKRANEA